MMSDLITHKPEDWLLNLLYDANKTDVETYRVFRVYSRYISDNRDFIGITEQVTDNCIRYKPVSDVADDCLFSVTFFTECIKHKQNRYGAPGVSYYSSTGKRAFSLIGYPSISNNWDFWINYVSRCIKFNK